jgi:hypothetical protein
MPHTSSCSNATSRTCHCGGCAGSQHGWQGAIGLAQPGQGPARAALRQSAERAWADATKRRFRTRLTSRRARAAVDGAKADIEDWLASALADPPAAPGLLVSKVGDVVAGDVFDALCAALGTDDTNRRRAELAENHLFCSLLAEIACSMQELEDEFNRATKRVASALLSYYIGRYRVEIPPAVAETVATAAVKGIDQLAAKLPVVRQFRDLHTAVRILAVVMCPAPERHEAVIRCALRPLGEPVVSAVVRERLAAAMPDLMA